MTDPFRVRRIKLINIITDLSLTTNLKLCLDAGDENSYTSGNKWLDVSGGGNDFYLGSDGATAAEKPTFNGIVGGASASEYWLFDGSQFFRHDAANPAFVETMHKDNAVWSALFMYSRVVNPVAAQAFFGTHGGSSANTGISLEAEWASADPRILVFDNAAEFQESGATGPGIHASNVVTTGWGVDEAAGAAGSWQTTNGASDHTFNAANASAVSASATYTMEIGGAGNGAVLFANTMRLHGVAIWTGVQLSVANFASIQTLLTPRLT